MDLLRLKPDKICSCSSSQISGNILGKFFKWGAPLPKIRFSATEKAVFKILPKKPDWKPDWGSRKLPCTNTNQKTFWQHFICNSNLHSLSQLRHRGTPYTTLGDHRIILPVAHACSSKRSCAPTWPALATLPVHTGSLRRSLWGGK